MRSPVCAIEQQSSPVRRAVAGPARARHRARAVPAAGGTAALGGRTRGPACGSAAGLGAARRRPGGGVVRRADPQHMPVSFVGRQQAPAPRTAAGSAAAGPTREPYSVRRIAKTSAGSPICCHCMAVEGKWPSGAPAPRAPWALLVGELARVKPDADEIRHRCPCGFRVSPGGAGFRPGGAPAEKPARNSPVFPPGGADGPDGRQGRAVACRAPMPSSRYSRPAAKFPSQSSSVM